MTDQNEMIRPHEAATSSSALDHSFLARLREETGEAHRQLEDTAGLTQSTIDRTRVAHFLSRMYGFLVPLEIWLARSPIDPAFLEPRRKTSVLAKDLRRIGVEAESIDLMALDREAPSLPSALGALYVVEGSTLGSQVIGRWLGQQAWFPAGGIAYFDIYGDACGRMWRETRARLSQLPPSSHNAAIASANAIFHRLDGWMDGRARA
ncbi:biliverdin-producing heme oxygenase [Pararhizobium haloflavum]|uniref:biliverdin-producing heme oxygenase n=1 Tax=Pararhizobium haloflavum TaxID=2037914 RepID=UPI00130012BC|nr:biliverdin-producing heme oxygenase [Pararhizobium haloflavum]